MAENIDNTKERFNIDVTIGEMTEYFIVSKLKNKYPNIIKKDGYFKEYDIIGGDEREIKIEVKTDLGFHVIVDGTKRGNLFIEYMYLDNFSGILKTESDYWYHSNGENIWRFDTKDLFQELFEREKGYPARVMRGKDNGTHGYIFENALEHEYCQKYLLKFNIPEDSKIHYHNLIKLREDFLDKKIDEEYVINEKNIFISSLGL